MAAVVAVSAWALYESVLGLMQLSGYRVSGHARFAMTGSFDNPGPYGGVLAILLAVLVSFIVLNRKDSSVISRVVRIIALVASALCVIVLPATFSRAAWLSFAVAMLVLGFKELGLRGWIAGHRRLSAVLVVFAVLAGIGIFCLKADSAIGRLHIWHMELRAIAEEPLTGHGPGTVLGIYGREQAEYFAEKERPDIIVKVAGCPEYAFNEYLRVGVEYGLPVMFALLALLCAVIVLLLKKHSPFAYGLIAFAVFAFFSYPLSLFKINGEAEEEWESVRHLVGMELYEEAVDALAPLYGGLSGNYRYLYDYGYALHKTGKYEESIDILQKGVAISSDPMFHNIIGKNNEALGLYEEARKHYIHAHYMVPCRIYPLSLLMQMHMKLGQDEEALELGRKILDMPVNEKHRTMLQLRQETAAAVDSLMTERK